MKTLSQSQTEQSREAISALLDGEAGVPERVSTAGTLNEDGEAVHQEQLRALSHYQSIGEALRGQAALTQTEATVFVAQWRERLSQEAATSVQVVKPVQIAANDVRWKWGVGLAGFAALGVGLWVLQAANRPAAGAPQWAEQAPIQQPNVQATQTTQTAKAHGAPTASALVLTQGAHGAVLRDPRLDAALVQQRLVGAGTSTVQTTAVKNAAFETSGKK